MDSIEGVLQRPKFYNNIDGVGELGMGVMMLGYAMLMWLQVHSPESAIWHKMYVFFLWVGGMIAIIHYGSKAIKEHVTYRRTGFVEYRKRNRIWPAAIAFVVSALVAAGLAFAVRSNREIGGPHWGLTEPVALIGLVFAAAYGYGIARSVRWKWAVVGVIAICSLTIAMLPPDWAGAIVGSPSNAGPFSPGSVGAWLLIMLTYAAILLISGGVSFVLYLRHTQPPAEAA
jgi:hypothetical protein